MSISREEIFRKRQNLKEDLREKGLDDLAEGIKEMQRQDMPPIQVPKAVRKLIQNLHQ